MNKIDIIDKAYTLQAKYRKPFIEKSGDNIDLIYHWIDHAAEMEFEKLKRHIGGETIQDILEFIK